MTQPVDAIFTGFVKSPWLLERSLATPRRLKQENILRNIHYVTWDSAEIDPYVAPFANMPDVHLVRVPQPQVAGNANQRGVTYQIHNLDAALSQVAEEDTLVFKSRLDFIVDVNFLREKIRNFATLCATPGNTVLGATMPEPVLREKIWIPWSDSNHPFFCDDSTCLGRKRDLRNLVTALTADDYEVLANPDCRLFPHVVRFARIFLPRYPLFERYLRDYRYFVNDIEYRVKLIRYCLNDGFFWHMAVANAWILHSQFHVDAGERDELSFYPNNINKDTDWSDPQTFRIARPYNRLDQWRAGTKPDRVLTSIQRPYGRLMDDAWQSNLFTRVQPDFPQNTLIELLTNIAQCGGGRLAGIEDKFYRNIAALHEAHWQRQDDRCAI